MLNIYSGIAFLVLITGLLVLLRMDRKGSKKGYPFPMRNVASVSSEDKTAFSKADTRD